VFDQNVNVLPSTFETATDAAEFVVDLELANEAEVSVSLHEKRRGAAKQVKQV
jgi:hypothetical protein